MPPRKNSKPTAKFVRELEQEVRRIAGRHYWEDIAVDFGPGEEMVGIEILSASEHLGFDPQRPVLELIDLSAA